MQEQQEFKRKTGGCLCGRIRFEIHGDIRGVVNCHCSTCRRFHGTFGAYTRVLSDRVDITKASGLTWFASPTDETPHVRRGFCSHCGASLFWHPDGEVHMSIAAGALDQPTHLKTIGHIWCSQKPDYYQITDDLPRFDERWEA